MKNSSSSNASRAATRDHSLAATDAEPSASGRFVLVSLKHTRPHDRYVTFWRPNAAGYCWPLSWAGVYGEREALANSDDNPGEETFAVPVDIAYRLSRAPSPGYIDGDAGPVVTKRRIAALRAAALAKAEGRE